MLNSYVYSKNKSNFKVESERSRYIIYQRKKMRYTMEHKEYLILAEDLCALGSLSTTAAFPILESQGISVALLPTGIMSTQSEGFGTPVRLETAVWIKKTIAHWKTQHVPLQGALLGYIDSVEVSEVLKTFLKTASLRLVVVDPVMADEGKLYPSFTTEQLNSTEKLLKYADISTPNLTEACFLAGRVCLKEPSKLQQKELLLKMQSQLKAGGKAVITGVRVQNKIGCIWLENGIVQSCYYPCLKGHFYGSGDIFAALLTGSLWNGASFGQAVRFATKVTYHALRGLENKQVKRRFGVELMPIIKKILEIRDE